MVGAAEVETTEVSRSPSRAFDRGGFAIRGSVGDDSRARIEVWSDPEANGGKTEGEIDFGDVFSTMVRVGRRPLILLVWTEAFSKNADGMALAQDMKRRFDTGTRTYSGEWTQVQLAHVGSTDVQRARLGTWGQLKQVYR